MPETHESSGADQLLLSASCGFAEPPTEEVARRLEIAGLVSRARGSNRYSTPAESIREADPLDRDVLLASAVSRLLKRLTAAGIDREFVVSTRASVHLYVSLSSTSESAGFMLDSSTWSEWALLGATLRVDVI